MRDGKLVISRINTGCRNCVKKSVYNNSNNFCNDITDNIMTEFRKKGINWGVLVITIAILIPIATKEIGFLDLVNAFKSPIGWVAILSGIGVSLLSEKGVNLLSGQPEITVALVFGTIIGVVFMKGVAAGPVIASGITYCILQIINIIWKK